MFNDRTSLFCRLPNGAPILSVYGHLYSGGELRPVYGGIFTVGGYDEAYLFPTWVAT
jgi:hypothetical protein